MSAGRMYDFTAQGDVCKGTGGKGQQRRPSHGLERPGLGTLSHRVLARSGPGGSEMG